VPSSPSTPTSITSAATTTTTSHSETYSPLIDTYIKAADPLSIKRKVDWANRSINDERPTIDQLWWSHANTDL
jgi:hypothetical protein